MNRLLYVSLLLLTSCADNIGPHPGVDFPAAWLPEGIDRSGFERTEKYVNESKLAIQKSEFAQWCVKHEIEYDKDRLEKLEFVGGAWMVVDKKN